MLNIFRFQKIFDQEAKQDVVFDSIAKPVAEWYVVDLAGSRGNTGSKIAFTVLLGGELVNICLTVVKVDWCFNFLNTDMSESRRYATIP